VTFSIPSDWFPAVYVVGGVLLWYFVVGLVMRLTLSEEYRRSASDNIADGPPPVWMVWLFSPIWLTIVGVVFVAWLAGWAFSAGAIRLPWAK
jgi:hypothetical protein